MKKTIIFFIAILCTVQAARSQADVVMDPVQIELQTAQEESMVAIKANMLEQLQEAVSQTEELEKQFELAKDAWDYLDKVNNALTQLEIVEKAIARQLRLIDRTETLLTEFNNSDLFSVEEYQTITTTVVDLIQQSTAIIDMFYVVIEPGRAKMSDSERMQLLLDIEDKANEKFFAIRQTMTHYERLKESREVVSALEQLQDN